MRHKPVSGEFYRHFKGKLYQIKMLAKDSETQEEKVVYQAMYEPYGCWVRGLEEFMSPVDREKYPEAVQEYRFEKVDFQENMKEGGKQPEVEKELADTAILEQEIANRGLMQLLDAETFHEKKQIFIGLKQYMNKHMLNNIAVALDIVLEEGDEEMQYESVMHCLEAFERYEGGRLR